MGWTGRCKPGLMTLLVAVAILAGMDNCYYRERLYPGIALGEVDLGGLKIAEAQTLLEKSVFSTLELSLTLDAEREYIYTFSELGLAWDRAETMHLLRIAGRSWSGVAARLAYRFHGTLLTVPVGISIDETRLDLALSELAATIYRPARPASFVIDGARVSIDPGEPGRSLDTALLRDRILTALEQGFSHLAVEIPITVLPAHPGAAELSRLGVQELMASFATEVSGSIADRVHNIALGAAAVHGTLVGPGEEFSFNRTVGPSTREKGYREAPVIAGNRLVPGLGGGLCQVSSTLYNAALLANLSIVARSSHSLIVSYLPPGRDATVAYDLVDLKFVNNHSHHVLIGMEMKEGHLLCRIFGLPQKEKIKIVSTDLHRIEAPIQELETEELPVGVRELMQEGKPGFNVNTWRVFFRDGEEARREKLSADYYEPVPSVYWVGIGPAIQENGS